MYKIVAESFGYRVTTAGSFTVDEIEQMRYELLRTLSEHDRPFSLLLDSRRLIPPSPDVVEVFVDLHRKVWQLSCERMAFVVNSPVAKVQILQMHYIASAGKRDRVIDASKRPDWEEVATAWATDARDPDTSDVLSPEGSK